MMPPMTERYDTVKVFSATKAKERDALGDVVTAWLRANAGVTVVEKMVRLSSDKAFHCLTIVLFLNSSH
jgi:hypothetical protein